jgi:hypothetical protein
MNLVRFDRAWDVERFDPRPSCIDVSLAPKIRSSSIGRRRAEVHGSAVLSALSKLAASERSNGRGAGRFRPSPSIALNLN